MSIIEKALEKLGHDGSGVSDAKPVTENKDNANSKSTIELSSNIDENINVINNETDLTPSESSQTVMLDLDKMQNMGFLTPNSKNMMLIEQYRHIKLRILDKVFHKKEGSVKANNLILLTSAHSGEGKTFTSLNLALSIAYEYNYTVLFVDADIIKKSASRILELEDSSGLTDYLLNDELSLSNLLYKTNIPKLSLLPTGCFSDKATELFSSHRMFELMQELSTRYNDRIVIIDTPPLLQDSSAYALLKHVDQTLVVVEAEKTPRHIVLEALRRAPKDLDIGMILNKSNQHYGENYGYYA